MRTSSPSIATPARTNNRASPARLAFFWFGIQAIWGALLGISLQARSAQIVGSHALIFYGYLATSGALVAAAVQLLVGPLSDRRRRAGSRRIEFYVIGAVLGSGALVWFYRAQSPWSLLCAYAALQAGLNIAINPYQAAIPDLVESKSAGIASAWMAGLQSAGNAAGATLATVVGNGVVLAGVLGALLLATCAATARAVRVWPPRAPSQRAAIRFSRAFALLFLSRASLFAGFYTLLGYLFFYTLAFVTHVQRQARIADGELILAFTLVGAAGAALGGRPSDRFDRRNVATVGALCAVAALTIFVVGRSPIAAAAAILIGGLGWGVFLVADWAIACRVIPQASAAGGMALWNLAVIAPQIVAPLAATALVQRLGGGLQTGVTAAFILAGLEMLLGIGLLRRLPAGLTRE